MKIFTLLISLLLPFMLQAQSSEGLKRINGAELFVSANGKGESLVVIHGGPGLNQSYFKPHLINLEKNFRVIYYDQRASGRSATPSADSISIAFFVEDLEGIRKTFKLDKLSLLTHSWGSVLATHYALRYPHRVSKIIFSNPAMLSREYDEQATLLRRRKTTRQDSLMLAEMMSSGQMDITKYEEFFRVSFRASASDPNNMQKLKLDLPENFMDANKILFTGLSKDPHHSLNLYDSLRPFRFPTLIIHGQADIIPPESIERMKTNLPGSELIIFKKSGHFPFIEETDKFNQTVLQFLKK